jgi:hypothetical protein
VPTFFRSFMASLAADRTFPAVRIVSLGGRADAGPGPHVFQSALRAALRAHARVRSDRVPHRLLGARPTAPSPPEEDCRSAATLPGKEVPVVG